MFDTTFIREQILDWYAEQISAENPPLTDIPWRQSAICSSNVLVGELLLERFVLDRAKRHYCRFVKRFPNWEVIAKGTVPMLCDKLPSTGIWRRRALTLRYLAKLQLDQDIVPIPTLHDMAQLPGISATSAPLFRSIIFDVPHPQFGAELKRLLTRLYGIESDAYGTDSLSTGLEAMAFTLVQHPKHLTLNWGIKQLANQVCTDEPICERCPLKAACYKYAIYST